MRRTLFSLALSWLFIPTTIWAAEAIYDSPGRVEGLHTQTGSILQIQKDIGHAHDYLSTMASSTPKKVIEATAFFANDMKIEQALSLTQKYNLKLKGFRHGTPDYSGGYIFDESERAEEAVKNYLRDHEFFLKLDIENTERMIKEAGSDRDIETALSARLRSVIQRQEDYAKFGVRVIGLDLEGEASELNRLWDEDLGSIRVIDVNDQGRSTPNTF